ncbi:MAG: PAC2 family protein [Desulfurococcaceae archaeon]
MIKFVPLKEVDLASIKNSYFITGYQGFGLVGYLTTKHLAKELRLRKIGFVRTKYMPEFTMYSRDHDLLYPFEVYSGEVGSSKVVIVMHNSTPVERERTDYIDFLSLFAKKLEASEVILIGGLSQELREDSGEKYRWIPINDTKISLVEARLLEDRHIVGPLALTMMFMRSYGLRGVVILPFAEPLRPDPKASAVAVEVVARILGVSVSTQRLIEEALIIEAVEAEREKVEKVIEESERRPRLTYI